MLKAKESFSAYLKKKGLRSTRQREDIIDAFLNADRRITAEDLCSILQKKFPGIGYATVHRNLKLMCECGLSGEIKIGEQKHGHEHHAHLLCTKCDRFIEVKNEQIERFSDELAKANDFPPLRHKQEIYGLCSKR